MTGERVGTDWRLHGVRVVHADELDVNTPQTPGMNRAAAITAARAGAEKLWAGTVSIHPDAKTGAHHHGPLESVIYVVSGQARMRWGERLEFMAEAGPGDFHLRPPVRAAPGDQRQPGRPLVVRGRTQRSGGSRRQPGPARRRAQSRTGPLGRRHPPGALISHWPLSSARQEAIPISLRRQRRTRARWSWAPGPRHCERRRLGIHPGVRKPR